MAKNPSNHLRAMDVTPSIPTLGDDFLFGSDSANYIDGLAGNDNISGFGERDILYGRAGHDALFGGDGDDTLNGGADADYLEGGAGADQFTFVKSRDSYITPLPGEPGHFTSPDIIADFDSLEGDRLFLRKIDADIRNHGDQAFRYIGDRDFTGRAGQLRMETGETQSFLYGDTDGNKKADFVVEFTGHVELHRSDFYL